MPKKKMPRSEGGLPSVSPRSLSSKEKRIYQELRSCIVASGYDSSFILELVVITVRQIARMKLMGDQVNKFKDLTVEGSTGQIRIHPLVPELRAMEIAVQSSLGKLLLTPRSRSVARLAPAPQQTTAEDDCILRLLGEPNPSA